MIKKAAMLLLLLVGMTLTATAQSNAKKRTGTGTKARTTTTTKKGTGTAKKSSGTTKARSSAQTRKDKENNAYAAEARKSKNVKALQGQKDALQKQISASETLLQKTDKNVKTQLMQVAALNGQIEEQDKYVQQINTEIKDLNAQIERADRELRHLEAELADRKHKYEHSVKYMRQNRVVEDQIVFIFSADNLSKMYRRMRYVKEYATYMRVEGKKLEKKQEEVELKREELTGMMTEKTQLANEGEREKARLEENRQKQQVIVENLEKQKKQLSNEIAKKRKEGAALDAKIEQVIAQEIEAARKRAEAERARQEAARRAAEAKRRAEEEAARKAKAQQQAAAAAASGKKKKGTTASTSTESLPAAEKVDKMDRFIITEDQKLNGSFESNRGRLPVPITGPYFIAGRFGSYNVPGLKNVQLDNKGVNYVGKSGAKARAIFGGEVSAVFQMGGTKNILVRHGSYISVYCNLSSVNVSRGAKVNARDVLGSVADDGSGNCVLHFQLRKETAKLNPEAWIGR
jgi:septal ring factor EnvC (AmiA/AmiB activator)